jgi:hypothetical protein
MGNVMRITPKKRDNDSIERLATTTGKQSGNPRLIRNNKSMSSEQKYRAFISYSHKDIQLVRQIVRILQENGLEPMWDENLLAGQGFDEQIKNYIAHAHVFLPVLTSMADSRKWVHQEIGFAAALNVPVLPVVVGEPSGDGEMLHRLHSLRISAQNLDPLRVQVTQLKVQKLQERHADSRLASYACADYPEARASMIAQYCEDVCALGRYGLVRQKGGLSSFHIPTQTVQHKIWQARYGRKARSIEHCRLQWRERLALAKHVHAAGCKLIVNPTLTYRAYGDAARRLRLACLRDFLAEMPDGKCHVALSTDMGHSESLTIVGDWFIVKSVSAHIGSGYFQTIFTRHALTVLEAIAQFDEEFSELLQDNGTRPQASRRTAIRAIEREIKSGKKRTKTRGSRHDGRRVTVAR